ncbi:telomere length regulation protein-domain-containing protein [Amylostereum chailletii]|nr:telomere length regulation protein-domain-containing protein [Amylostereum chailletii]
MATEFADTTVSQVRNVISRLQSPVPDLSTLLGLLAGPLDALSLLPPIYRKYNTDPLLHASINIPRHLPALQRALLEHVAPTWGSTLVNENLMPLVQQYFVPDAFSYAHPVAGQVSLYAYSVILSLPLRDYSVNLLARLTTAYPIDRLHTAIFGNKNSTVGQTTIAWEDAVRYVISVPVKVANALAGHAVPAELEQGAYFRNLCMRCEVLLASLAEEQTEDSMSSLTYLFTKLANVGAFPPSIPTSPSQPSFFHHTLEIIRSRISAKDTQGALYSVLWSDLLLALPSSFTVQGILTSLFAHLSAPEDALDMTLQTRARVKREAEILGAILGDLKGEKKALWDSIGAVVLGRDWQEGYARIFVCWVAGTQKETVDEEALGILIEKTIDIWSASEYIKRSLLSKHRYTTLLLLGAIAHLSPTSNTLRKLPLLPPFIQCIGTYIGHLDPSVRRCGMLVAEEVAHRTGRKLDFGDWDGDEGGKGWARQVRQLFLQLDRDAAAWDDASDEEGDATEILTKDVHTHKTVVEISTSGYDSDDSLVGYASPSSSRSPSPTPSELEEIEKDPTLRVGQKKIARPVYLAQLGEMLRSRSGLNSEHETQEADKIDVALDVAEELIRRKRFYGTELQENAVNLVHGLIALNNNFELDDFDRKRQAALNALVACCPHKAALSIIEEFFKNQYSTDQRYVMLNALALGAQELAGLPIPAHAAARPMIGDRISFPSKRLPGLQHQRYLTEYTNQVYGLLEGITKLSISNTREANTDRAPELARERQLRVRQLSKVSELHTPAASQIARGIRGSTSAYPLANLPSFTEVGVEQFIYPLLHRFWLFLRDEQTREERTALQDRLHQYHGAGTGLILNSLVLHHFLATLGVLVHAARNAPSWRALVAPDALELAVTLGTRPLSRAPEDDDEEETETGGGEGKEARVLTTALELALVVLDGCVDQDGGRTLGLEHTTVLLATGEWAQTVFGGLEKGLRVRGGGGAAEMRLSRAAAGVILKVDEISNKWRRSMIDLTNS